MVRSLKNCERSLSTPLRMPSKTSIGKPPGLAAVFTIKGGTAPIRTALATDIAGNFAAAGGMADMNSVSQIELLHELREVIGIGVHVVAVPGLARTAVAATVVGDDTIAMGGEIEHLVLKGIAAQRPAMAEDDRLTRSPILVIDLGSVLGRDRAHGPGSLSMMGYGRLTSGCAACGRNQGQRGDTHVGEKD